MYSTQKVKQGLLRFNAVLTVLVLLAAFSLAELPLLHCLYHHHDDAEHISVSKQVESKVYFSTAGMQISKNDKVCPICSIGGVYHQASQPKDDFILQGSRDAFYFAEPSAFSKLKYHHARQRAPPVS